MHSPDITWQEDFHDPRLDAQTDHFVRHATANRVLSHSSQALEIHRVQLDVIGFEIGRFSGVD